MIMTKHMVVFALLLGACGPAMEIRIPAEETEETQVDLSKAYRYCQDLPEPIGYRCRSDMFVCPMAAPGDIVDPTRIVNHCNTTDDEGRTHVACEWEGVDRDGSDQTRCLLTEQVVCLRHCGEVR